MMANGITLEQELQELQGSNLAAKLASMVIYMKTMKVCWLGLLMVVGSYAQSHTINICDQQSASSRHCMTITVPAVITANYNVRFPGTACVGVMNFDVSGNITCSSSVVSNGFLVTDQTNVPEPSTIVGLHIFYDPTLHHGGISAYGVGSTLAQIDVHTALLAITGPAVSTSLIGANSFQSVNGYTANTGGTGNAFETQAGGFTVAQNGDTKVRNLNVTGTCAVCSGAANGVNIVDQTGISPTPPSTTMGMQTYYDLTLHQANIRVFGTGGFVAQFNITTSLLAITGPAVSTGLIGADSFQSVNGFRANTGGSGSAFFTQAGDFAVDQSGNLKANSMAIGALNVINSSGIWLSGINTSTASIMGAISAGHTTPAADSVYNLGDNTHNWNQMNADFVITKNSKMWDATRTNVWNMFSFTSGLSNVLSLQDPGGNTVMALGYHDTSGNPTSISLWRFHLAPIADNTYDLGSISPSTARWRNLYIANSVVVAGVTVINSSAQWTSGINTSSTATFGSTVTLNSTVNGTHGQNVGTGDTPQFSGLTLTNTLSSHAITPVSDSVYNLGDNTHNWNQMNADTIIGKQIKPWDASRTNQWNIQSFTSGSSNSLVTIDPNGTTLIAIGYHDNSGNPTSISLWKLHLAPLGDNTYDLGSISPSTARWRTLYLATSLIMGSTTVINSSAEWISAINTSATVNLSGTVNLNSSTINFQTSNAYMRTFSGAPSCFGVSNGWWGLDTSTGTMYICNGGIATAH